MATYAAFLRDTGIDGTSIQLNDDKTISSVGYRAIYGETYHVDNVNGLSTNNGLSWDTATATIVQAITLSNAYRAETKNAQKRNLILISGGTYSETVAALPSRTDIVGIGTALTGNWTVPTGGRAAGCHLHNLYWSKSGSTSVVSFTECSSLEISNCQFYGTTSNSIAVEIIGCAKAHIHDNTFFGNLNYAYGIKFTSGSCYGCRVYNNRICAKTTGIWVEDDCQCQTGVVHHNVIWARDANDSSQCNLGIDVNGNHPPVVYSNWISAVDAILPSVAADGNRDIMDNHINEAMVGGIEIPST